ncbi:MAG: hypothetical protein VKP72_00340 [bacterium]|nr:hypothetical protein [bacterium]
MPRITRTYQIDLDELIYHITCSDAFQELCRAFRTREISDLEAQERLLEVLERGRMTTVGERGPEVWEWSLPERELATLTARLVADHLDPG